MTCSADVATFRLLDAYVGWDADSVGGLDGIDDADGIVLGSSGPSGSVSEADLALLFGSPRLARGCGPCEWYLAAPGRRAPRMLHRGPCAVEFTPLWPGECAYPLADPVAVAALRHELAVADAGAGRVWAWSDGGRIPRASIAIARPGPVLFSACGQLLVAMAGTTTIRRFTPSGDDLGAITIGVRGEIVALALARDCAVWAAVRCANGAVRLYRKAHAAARFAIATLERARADLRDSGVEVRAEDGFCLDGGAPDAPPHCYGWDGQPAGVLLSTPVVALQPRGQLLTRAIDSGLPGCRWHRVRVDAEVPAGTRAAIAVAVCDSADPPDQGDPTLEPDWQAFPAGRPNAGDWQEAPAGALDFLVDQPPGRYLFVRLRLMGQAGATPRVRRVRLDFPRVTSFGLLPAVYRVTPEAEDFGERFMSLFDASIAQLDRAVERHPALLDVERVPDEALPWLGRFLELAAEPWWGPERHRRLLRAAPELYRRRGTPEALARAIELVFDVRPVIAEGAPQRAWGAVGQARVRAVRLFGRSRSRLRLGSSRITGAPLRSLGNPDLDPLLADAQRFTVMLPAGAVQHPDELASLRRLVTAQAPAHAVGSVRVGGTGLVVGASSAVGIDTALTPLPAPVLGGRGPGQVRLSRDSVLWPGGGGRHGIAPDRNALVGITTVTR
jgi:phage tail-like protein